MRQKLIFMVDPKCTLADLNELVRDLGEFLPDGTPFMVSTSITGMHVIYEPEQEES